MRNVMKLFVVTTFFIVSAGVSANVVSEIGRDKAKSDLGKRGQTTIMKRGDYK